MDGQAGTSLIFMIAMFAIFYFLLIRPQRNKDKKIREMRASLKRGDEIITIGGINGTIVKITDDYVVIELGYSKQRMKMEKWSVHSVINPSDVVEEVDEVEAPAEETDQKTE